MSFGWWVPKHNLHHSNPNHEDLDPDIGIAVLAFTVGQARDKRGLVRFIARHQAFLFGSYAEAIGHLHSVGAPLRPSPTVSERRP